MKYQAVIFDLFGTLVENFSRAEYEKTLAEMANILNAPPDAFIRLWSDTFNRRATGVFKSAGACARHICRELDVPVTGEQIERVGRIRYDYTFKNMKPRPDAAATLTALKSRGHKTGLISDCTAETPVAWQFSPLAPLFDVTVFSCRAGVKKPDARIYQLAAEKLAVKPEECLYIGDGSSRELTGASGVGMRAVIIRAPEEVADAHTIEREEWRGPSVSSLTEVLGLLG
jgi:putative hydrolase of the HAD superfamily